MKPTFTTQSEFQNLNNTDEYYKSRWDYFSKVIDILKNEQFNSALEIGAYKKSIINNCDMMDYIDRSDQKGFPKIKYIHDATNIPWPIKDKQYDLIIALQVWEHLYQNPKTLEGPKQKEAFRELQRTSNMAILSFPLNWNLPGDCHHGISEEKISQWTNNVKPHTKLKVNSRIIYFFKF